ncbi:MAG: outer membrane protein assembly factor [Gammaproteobacteria bacterium]|nr:outer membrane protein assembly factor [Gammaproteobacteria bacterium]
MLFRYLLIIPALLVASHSLARPVATIDGLSNDLAARVIERTPSDGVRCDSPRWVARTWSRDLEEEIRRSLRARSFYAPEIASRLERDDVCWQLSVTVDRGEATLLRGFDVTITGEGGDDPAFAAALDNLRPATGRPFREDAHEALKRGLRRVALERGYLDSRFVTARVDVYPAELAADVSMEFSTGIRYRFGDTRFTVEPDMLGASMLERFRLFEPGEHYSNQDVERLRRRLLQSGYFDSVDVNPQTEVRADGNIDLDVDLGLRPRHEFSGGFGFATDFGPRIKAAYENRYLNQRGHQGAVRLNLSPVLQELYSDYRMPLRRGDDAWLIMDATVSREDTDSAESITQAVGVRRVRSGPWGTRLTESLNLQREDFDVASDDDVAILLMPGIAISKTRQTRQRPLEIGWRLDGQVRGASTPLSSTSFLQFYSRGSLALPLGERARAVGRVELGTTLASSLSKLPTSIRYFAGGDRSIRGYKLDALGPTDAEGEVSGGRHLAVASIELERAIRGNWSVAVFADTGGAFNTFSEKVSSGVGVGVRWLSPVGPIRLDVAHPLDDDGTSVRLHIGVGSSFQ